MYDLIRHERYMDTNRLLATKVDSLLVYQSDESRAEN